MPANLSDLNVVFALLHSRHPQHLVAAEWSAGLAGGEAGICRHVQLGLLRLLTNRVVMGEDVLSNDEAWATWQTFIADDAFVFVPEPPDALEQLGRFGSSGRPSPNRWSDAYLAALAFAWGLELVTFDAGFRSFPGLRHRILIPNQAAK